MKGIKNQISLTTDLDMIVLNKFNQSQLIEYSTVLTESIESLKRMISLSKDLNDGLWEDLEINLSFAIKNNKKINAVLKNKTSDAFLFGEFATIGLN